MSEQYKKLMENFRISIRRRQIDQLFSTHRRELLRQQTQYLKQQLHYKLKTKEDREEWLKQTAEMLTSFPCEQWAQVIKNLYYAVSLYQNQHQKWIQLGIVKSITQVLKKQYLYLNLSKMSANILTDLLYTNSCTKTQNYQVIKKIMELQFVNDIVYLLQNTTEVQYIRLMGIICDVVPSMRNFILEHYGILDYIMQKFIGIKADYLDNIGITGVQSQFKNTEYLYCLLYLMRSLLKIHQLDKYTNSKPKKETILKTLPILNFLMEQPLSNRNLCLTLKCIRQICLMQKQQIYQQIKLQPSILPKVLQLLCYQNRIEIRLISIHILSNFLLSKDSTHTQYLLDKGILDKVHEAYFMDINEHQQKSYNSNFQFGLLGFLANLTADFWQFQVIVVEHRVMVEIIIAQAMNSYNQQIRREAVYSICNILCKLSEEQKNQYKYKISQKLLDQYKVIDILLSNITRPDRSVEIVKEILNIFKQVLINQDRINSRIRSKRGGGQIQTQENVIRFHRIFKQYYGVEDILENVVDYQEEVEDLVMEFLDFFRNLDIIV